MTDNVSSEDAELRPCPFCGGEAVFRTPFSARQQVGCINCYVNTAWDYDRAKAAQNWNTRIANTLDRKPDDVGELSEVLLWADTEGRLDKRSAETFARAAIAAIGRAVPEGE